MSGLLGTSAREGAGTGTVTGTGTGIFWIVACWRSSSDDESSTASTPNDPPYVLRGGAATAVDFEFSVLVGCMSSIRGLGLDDDAFPTVSHD